MQINLHLGLAVAISIELNERVVVVGVVVVNVLIAKLAMVRAEGGGPNKGEGLVAERVKIGIDLRKIDLVLALLEVEDVVAGAVRSAAVAQPKELEAVVAVATGHPIGALAAGDHVVSRAAIHRVVAGAAVHLLVCR